MSATMKTSRRVAASMSGRGPQGFALIEVLIALLLFAIGILGLVGLQATMTQTQTESKVRADAANLVDELSAVMWAELGNQNTTAKLAGFSTAGCAGDPACGAWLAKVQKALPGATLAKLEVNGAGDTDPDNGLVSVKLEWSLPNGGAHKYVSTFNVAQNTP